MIEWTEAQMPGGLLLHLSATPSGLRAVRFGAPDAAEGERNDRNALLVGAARQLRAYFAGELRAFSLPLDPAGSKFQKRVWSALLEIPYGETRSYGELAEAIGSPQAVRAVGAANGANPIAIIVPCHRVIGRSGKLVGYGGGLPLKRRLLDLETQSRAANLFEP